MNQNNPARRGSNGNPTALVCPSCDSGAVETFDHLDTFKYGSDESAASLQVKLPIRRCTSCAFEFLDDEGHQLKHEAVCRHLGVLSPREVLAVRERHGMTRAEFAQVTGLGEATLNRWENGAVVQNRANDRYLRLVETPWIMDRLQGLSTPEPANLQEPVIHGRRFPALEASNRMGQKRREQEGFQLRLAA